ncbi:MAG: peptide chain release factor N(5)-glutamine methyltransferase [Paenibacillus sp.]|nr:peptide chain release factor N(5)-glutamine methyltransferase [Paenibacillus sp.]
MTLSQYTRKAIEQLAPIYDASEARWIIRTMVENITGMNRTEIMLHDDDELEPETVNRYDGIIARLLKHEPIQYILGETYWHGLTLKVTPAVLIPREETSELVDLIVNEFSDRQDLNVMDLCTGSGCIAVALARNLPFASVKGVDISPDALAVARENASKCKVKVNFEQRDVLQSAYDPSDKYDLVVSNPPYIAQHEESKMDSNVLDYEPHIALFVPDDDPLKFYKAISANTIDAMKPGGKLYLEINPLYARQLSDMLEHDGWTDVNIIKDMHGKDRFATATKATS